MTFRGKAVLLATVASLAFSGQAWSGAGDDCCDDIEDLQRQILLLQSQLDELKNKQADADHKVVWKGAPRIEADGNKFKVRGRIFVDAVVQDGNASPLVSPEPFTSGTEFRAARLGVEGQIAKSTSYKFEVDFADNEVELKDAFIEQEIFGPGGFVQIGQFKTPNSIDELTSSRFDTFMEQSGLTGGFGLGRLIGLAVGWSGEQWSVKVGGFGDDADSGAPDTGAGIFEEQWVAAGRVTFAPVLVTEGTPMVIHVGGSIRYRTFEDTGEPGTSMIAYSANPGLHLSESFLGADFSDTATIGVDGIDSDLFYGVEFAGVYGPLHIMGEYAWLDPDIIVTPGFFYDDPKFHGFYVEAGVFLTGESRPYDGSVGEFGRVAVKKPVNDGGIGAWQIAMRYDQLDFDATDTDGDTDIDFGGKQKRVTAGVNWLLNDYTRFMINYVRADIADSPDAAALTGIATSDDVKLDQFGVRGQIDW